MVYELFVVIGISDALEIAAIDGFGLVMLGDGYGVEAFFAGGHVNVAAHEIHEVCTLQQELGHPRVVVVGGGDVAIAALVCLFWTRTVCGTNVLNAWPEKPGAEIVCCV